MANLCENRVTIIGLDADEKEAFTTLMEEGKFFDFFVTAPDFSHDPTNWELIQWRNSNWGSKWDIGDAYITNGPGTQGMTVHYDSAWSPHIEGFANLCARYPHLRVTIEYSESGAGFYGTAFISSDGVSDNCKEMYGNACA